jgi:tRNA-Thr(GGU) m(6)t(6)A37 methyltransferase TsaA
MANPTTPPRPGEIALPLDPAKLPGDAALVFIGRLRTPWTRRDQCPRNGRQSDAICMIEIDVPYRSALQGVARASHLIVLYWMHEARRDLAVQVPRHARPQGTFALRSPVRPNPVALSVVEVLDCDTAAGVLQVRGLDCLDGTPLIDIKPYFASVDSRPEATVAD